MFSSLLLSGPIGLVWFGGYVQGLHVEEEYTCIETEREKKTRTKAGWVCECGLNTMGCDVGMCGA